MSDHQIIVMLFVFSVLFALLVLRKDARKFGMGPMGAMFAATVAVTIILAVSYTISRLSVLP